MKLFILLTLISWNNLEFYSKWNEIQIAPLQLYSASRLWLRWNGYLSNNRISYDYELEFRYHIFSFPFVYLLLSKSWRSFLFLCLLSSTGSAGTTPIPTIKERIVHFAKYLPALFLEWLIGRCHHWSAGAGGLSCLSE